MKLLKKNQVIIYVIALMLVVAGYLNYMPTDNLDMAILASSTEEELAKTGNIGDAQLVSSNVFQEAEVENNIQTNTQDTNNSNINSNLENNTSENTITTNSNISKSDTNYFSTSKLERDTMYSQMIETYENILNSSNSLETQRQSATEEITKINNIKNGIMICENLIKTKGFKDVLIFVNGDSISVIIEDEQLSPDEVAQIQNIIARELMAKVENIHISNK